MDMVAIDLCWEYLRAFEECVGGDEPQPVFGRLGCEERVAKPTRKVGFLRLLGGVEETGGGNQG